MLTGAAAGGLACCKRRPQRECHEVFLTALRQHGGHSGILCVSVILCAPFFMTVRSAIRIEQGDTARSEESGNMMTADTPGDDCSRHIP